jgi:hypothetical protein
LFSRKSYVSSFTKNGLGYILGDFFTNQSGHPAQRPRQRLKHCFDKRPGPEKKNFFRRAHFGVKHALPNLSDGQGDQIGRIFAQWAIVFFLAIFWAKFREIFGLNFGRFFHNPIWSTCQWETAPAVHLHFLMPLDLDAL